jgi:DNA polymerase-3 subunit beta
MKIITTKEKLLNAVLIAERLVGKKESLPILACVVIQVEKDVVCKATNLEAGVEVSVPADIDEKGVVAVPAGVLSQTLRSISGDKITLKTDGANLVVESRGSKTLIKAIPHEEFPSLPLPREEKAAGVRLKREEFLQGLHSVMYAASPSMIRPELGSIFVSPQKGGVVCVATDSFRLAEKTTSGASRDDGDDVLIPLKHAGELVHVLERITDEEVRLSTEDSQMLLSASGLRFVSRVVDATFPNYKEIIPKKFTSEATVLKNDLAETLKKARVFSGGDQQVGFHLYPKRKIFTATAQSADVGEMSDTIDAALSGEDIDINFHIGYLSDCLTSIQSDSLILGFSGAGKPLVIRGVSDPAFMYLVMPLNR